MVSFVSPVFQIYVTPPVAKRESNCPVQTVSGPAIEIVGRGFTVTVTKAVSEHELLEVITE